ncbi:hypothetical protein [Roseibium sp.]|uniref:hypothetical protein n=1 Tax=Roseibium sp. TaxID=1936156 RepID=UPI0039F0F86A
MRDTLSGILKSWDGKATAPLEEAYADYRDHPGFLVTLTELCQTEEHQRAATWLLKHHFDQKKGPLARNLTELHIKSLPVLAHWETKLHVLQYLEHLTITSDDKVALCAFIDRETSSENKLVRAWAYYGLATLAQRFPEHKTSALEQLHTAQETESAGSIKVRIRKALQKLAD